MTITNDNYESLLYQYAEGTLAEADRQAVAQWLDAHPEAADELALFTSAPALVLPQATMPHKESLRRKAVIPVHWWRYAAAACAVLLTGLWTWLRSSPTAGTTPLVAEARVPAAIPAAPASTTEAHNPTPLRQTSPALPGKSAASHRTVPSPSSGELSGATEIPTSQPSPEEETVVVIYEEILAPIADDAPVLAIVATDTAYTPTLIDRLEDWQNSRLNQLRGDLLMARAEVVSRFSRRP